MESKNNNSEEFKLDLGGLDIDQTPVSESINSIVSSQTPEDMHYDDNDNSANSIQIGDNRSPIIMLFGPRSSGKSMTLVRLSRYLRDQGYEIVPDLNFRAGNNYREKCKKFMEGLDTQDALPGTAYTDFLLVKIVKNGRTICQFLEAPGEHYFSKKNVSAKDFPSYMTEIIRRLRNRKIWAFITEADWNVDFSTKKAYVTRITNCYNQLMTSTDRSIIMYNKIDQKPYLIKSRRVSLSNANKEMSDEYQGLVNVFKNNTPIVSLVKKYKYEFVPFCTGYYTSENGRLVYTESEDMYPAYLWKSIMKCIKG